MNGWLIGVVDRAHRCEPLLGDNDLLLEAGDAIVGLIEALEIAQAYVDDAALTCPEHFKPGIVKRHAAHVRASLARATGEQP